MHVRLYKQKAALMLKIFSIMSYLIALFVLVGTFLLYFMHGQYQNHNQNFLNMLLLLGVFFIISTYEIWISPTLLSAHRNQKHQEEVAPGISIHRSVLLEIAEKTLKSIVVCKHTTKVVLRDQETLIHISIFSFLDNTDLVQLARDLQTSIQRDFRSFVSIDNAIVSVTFLYRKKKQRERDAIFR